MIWCVDDDRTIREIEVYTLEQTGFEAKGFPDGLTMLEALQEEIPDLILLDIMMPGMEGTEVLRTLRANHKYRDIPVIMATAKDTEMDKIGSLNSGADDYLVKPFGVMEMVARVKAVLRRSTRRPPAEELCVGLISLNDQAHKVQAEGQAVVLTNKEFSLLKLLLENTGTVFTRETLMHKVWGMDFMGESRTVDMHIKTLRKKLGNAGGQIKTVIGVGYKLEQTL